MQTSQKQATDQTAQTPADSSLDAKYASIQSLGIPMLEVDSSTQMGGAGLVENEGKITVSLDVTPLEGDQPASIRLGSCPTPGEEFSRLNTVTSGKSETILESLQIKDILQELPMVIVIGKSESEASTYTSCGDIILPSEE